VYTLFDLCNQSYARENLETGRIATGQWIFDKILTGIPQRRNYYLFSVVLGDDTARLEGSTRGGVIGRPPH